MTPWTAVARQATLSREFSRPEYRSGYLSLLQVIFPTQGSYPCLPHCRWILYQLSYQGSAYTVGALEKELYVPFVISRSCYFAYLNLSLLAGDKGWVMASLLHIVKDRRTKLCDEFILFFKVRCYVSSRSAPSPTPRTRSPGPVSPQPHHRVIFLDVLL